MSHPDLPDGYYLAEQAGWSHAIFRHVTQYGKSHWRDSIDQRMPDPRTLDHVLTSVSAITAMKADLAAMTARAEKAEKMAADLAGIPKVAGHLRISLTEMIRNAGVLLTEAEITAAHVPLAPFLCDVIRVCREYGDAMQVRP